MFGYLLLVVHVQLYSTTSKSTNNGYLGSYAIYLSGFAIAGAGGELWRDLPELGKGPQMPPKCIS